MSTQTTIVPSICILVQNECEHGKFFVRHGEFEGRYYADISVISTFGNFGFYWYHMGMPLHNFLDKIGFDYVMNKMMGKNFMVPLDAQETCKKVRALVLDGRKNGYISVSDARELWDATDDVYAFEGTATILEQIDTMSGGALYNNLLYEHDFKKPNQQAGAFWEMLWPLFVKAVHETVLVEA